MHATDIESGWVYWGIEQLARASKVQVEERKGVFRSAAENYNTPIIPRCTLALILDILHCSEIKMLTVACCVRRAAASRQQQFQSPRRGFMIDCKASSSTPASLSHKLPSYSADRTQCRLQTTLSRSKVAATVVHFATKVTFLL